MPPLLADLTTLRLGGPAAAVCEAADTAAVIDAVRSADDAGEPLLIVGGGSNLVVADAGWPGRVVLVRSSDMVVERDGELTRLTVDAGLGWDDVVSHAVDAGWSGLAAMSGIPGSSGATPVQNVGAYGSEVADVIGGLRVLDRLRGEVQDWTPERCGFGFRTSAFKHTDRFVVLSVTFVLRSSPEAPAVRYLELARQLGVRPGGVAPSTQVRDVVLELRRSKGMVLDAGDHDTWSVGSFFVNPFVSRDKIPDGCPSWTVNNGPADEVKLSAAWLIEQAGFGKGFGADRGRRSVGVSTKHCLALTNRGGATTAELIDLARIIRDGVRRRFDIELRPEAHLVGVEL